MLQNVIAWLIARVTAFLNNEKGNIPTLTAEEYAFVQTIAATLHIPAFLLASEQTAIEAALTEFDTLVIEFALSRLQALEAPKGIAAPTPPSKDTALNRDFPQASPFVKPA